MLHLILVQKSIGQCSQLEMLLLTPLPRHGAVGNAQRHFLLSGLEGKWQEYWYLVSRDQLCCSTSYNAQVSS